MRLYPFECFKKLFKDASRASLLALAKSVTINKIETREASDHLAPKNSDTLRNFKLESFTC